MLVASIQIADKCIFCLYTMEKNLKCQDGMGFKQLYQSRYEIKECSKVFSKENRKTIAGSDKEMGSVVLRRYNGKEITFLNLSENNVDKEKFGDYIRKIYALKR